MNMTIMYKHNAMKNQLIQTIAKAINVFGHFVLDCNELFDIAMIFMALHGFAKCTQ